ncbi:hypothetical protein, partial [Duganella callida]|uniref:hypothetical protein n=1 Tax=Duganella callida TaxID=2561932 RepID=UPI00197A7AE3
TGPSQRARWPGQRVGRFGGWPVCSACPLAGRAWWRYAASAGRCLGFACSTSCASCVWTSCAGIITAYPTSAASAGRI